LKLAQDQEDYEDKHERLLELQNLEKSGHISLLYGDESGFCLNPVIPYGWQFMDDKVHILPKPSKRLNVLGFMSQANELHTFEKEGTINSEFVIDAIHGLVERKMDDMRVRPLVLVLDNARIHHAKLFKNQVEIWQEKNLFIFFLPTYSPHLNKIEVLWRRAKYQWLRPEDYLSFQELKSAVTNIFQQFGGKYSICFKTLEM
jgi:transposase